MGLVVFVAGFYRSASAFMNLLLPALKIVGEYYPGRLHKAFVIDPPSLFAYLWKVLFSPKLQHIPMLYYFSTYSYLTSSLYHKCNYFYLAPHLLCVHLRHM